MTANGNFKRRVRARAAHTGESYTSALRHFRQPPEGLRLAVAQTTVREDPTNSGELRASGHEIRCLMREARSAGARMVHFPEGATCFPHKRIMSVDGPEKVGPADWTRFEWDVLGAELAETARLAGELGLWTVLGAVHRLTPPHRPHNSLYVLSDKGRVATRYDERMLSNTKISYMYSPGTAPVTFQVDGMTFGLALGIEAHFPELFLEYETLDVDCVLFSTAGPGTPVHNGVFATEAQAHAASNSYWISYAAPAQDSPNAPSGVVSPAGEWLARCAADGTPALAIVDLADTGDPARPWRRTARGGVYDEHVVHDDPRSTDRSAF